MTTFIFARGSNIKAQVDQCREYAESKGYQVAGVIVGGNGSIAKTIRDLQKDTKVERLIVRDLARLSRRMHENFQIQHELEYDCGVEVEVASEQPKSKVAGNYMRNIVQYISEYE